MKCKGCKYNRTVDLKNIRSCLSCKRAYPKETIQHEEFTDNYIWVFRNCFIKKENTIEEKRLIMQDFGCSLVITCFMSLALYNTWERLERLVYGTIGDRSVDNIMMLLIIISFWFNARDIVRWIKNSGQ